MQIEEVLTKAEALPVLLLKASDLCHANLLYIMYIILFKKAKTCNQFSMIYTFINLRDDVWINCGLSYDNIHAPQVVSY